MIIVISIQKDNRNFNSKRYFNVFLVISIAWRLTRHNICVLATGQRTRKPRQIQNEKTKLAAQASSSGATGEHRPRERRACNARRTASPNIGHDHRRYNREYCTFARLGDTGHRKHRLQFQRTHVRRCGRHRRG